MNLFEQPFAITFFVICLLNTVTDKYVTCDIEFYYNSNDLFASLADELFLERHSNDFDSFTGRVGAYNYTYYTYEGEEPIRVKLITVTGDVDLYIGEQDEKPTYELHKHSLQSTTCGDDILDVPASLKRPIVIGVYGHPSHEESAYVLQVSRIDDIEEMPTNGYTDDQEESSANKRTKYPDANSREHKNDDDSSLFWELLLSVLGGLLKIVIDVMT